MCNGTLQQSREEGKDFLNKVYSIPEPFQSYEEDQRYYHEDISHLSRPEMRRELEKVRLRLTIDDNPPDWLLERLGIVEEELNSWVG